MTLSVIAIVYTSLVALVQEDMKKLIAYSSVAHMGFVTMGLFSLNTQGVQGAVFQMVSHGIVSGALFLCVGVVYDRHAHARDFGLWRHRQDHAALMLWRSWCSPWPMSACRVRRALWASSLR